MEKISTLHSPKSGETVTKKDLSEYLATVLGVPEEETEVMLNICFVYIQDCLISGNHFQLPGVGTLKFLREDNKKVNVVCKGTTKVKAVHKTIRFVISNTMRGILNNKMSGKKESKLASTSICRYDLMKVAKLREKLGISVGETMADVTEQPEAEYLRAFTEHQGKRPEFKLKAYGKYLARKYAMRSQWKKK